jgi:Holliday junction resolvase RusA-like endonuclease
MIKFEIDGIPVAKGRVKFARRGKFNVAYTPEKTRTYEDHVRQAGMAAMGSMEPLETPVKAYFYVRLLVPKSYSKKRMAACLSGDERPAKKPDLDNIIKSLTDGLNGVCYHDDSQIVDLHATKAYATVAGVDVLIMEALL